MKKYLINLFNKPNTKTDFALTDDDTRFILKISDQTIGYLYIENNKWVFKYSEEFKNQKQYYRLVGFSDLNKTYTNETLWPFFKVRIPGLKQPMIQEIIRNENIKTDDELSLLKRFGKKNASNPYILEIQ